VTERRTGLPDDPTDGVDTPDLRPAAAVASLLETERQAEQIVAQARKEAAGIVADAKARAQAILAASPANQSDAPAERAREAVRKQLAALRDAERRHIEWIRATAEPRLDEAARAILELLFGVS
jgi:cell division septum initiation protein DivIVA